MIKTIFMHKSEISGRCGTVTFRVFVVRKMVVNGKILYHLLFLNRYFPSTIEMVQGGYN